MMPKSRIAAITSVVMIGRRMQSSGRVIGTSEQEDGNYGSDVRSQKSRSQNAKIRDREPRGKTRDEYPTIGFSGRTSSPGAGETGCWMTPDFLPLTSGF